MGQRLETNVVGNFAHPAIRIKQLGLRPLDSYSAEILSKCQTGRLLEHFAEIEGADMHRLGHIVQVDGVRLVSHRLPCFNAISAQSWTSRAEKPEFGDAKLIQ
jgi:hypothetical protein